MSVAYRASISARRAWLPREGAISRRARLNPRDIWTLRQDDYRRKGFIKNRTDLQLRPVRDADTFDQCRRCECFVGHLCPRERSEGTLEHRRAAKHLGRRHSAKEGGRPVSGHPEGPSKPQTPAEAPEEHDPTLPMEGNDLRRSTQMVGPRGLAASDAMPAPLIYEQRTEGGL